jgi:FlaA1/EpsC-like NDP-sugar epimerase
MTAFLIRHRRGASGTLHALLAAVALAAAFLLRFEFALDAEYRGMLLRALPLALAAKLIVFRGFSLRDLAWRDIGFEDLTRLTAANAAASLVTAVLVRVAMGGAFPRSIYVLDGLLCLALIVALRGVVKKLFDWRRAGEAAGAPRRIFIYGAGRAGRTLLSEIRAHPELGYHVVGFFDDDPGKRDLWLNGVRVLGDRAALSAVVRRERMDEGWLALPAASGLEIAAILEQCRAARVGIKCVPPLAELMDTRVLVEQIREVRLEDLLGRPPVEWEEGEVRSALAGKAVLVTGAGGSIGSELCRQIARFHPSALIGFDQAETALYHVEQEIREQFPALAFYPEVGSIQNSRRLEEVFRDHRPDAVYHAAAYKHVPMMEAHLFEALENNVFGTHNVARTAMASGVETFVLVSSDKAVRPANIMGASKRMAELVCLAAGASNTRTKFLAVRFGNVLGSSGSVIPLFKRQIAAGGPVTVTHPDMQRFFMTIPEAAQLVLQAATMGAGGEVFVLMMGEPVRIVDLARKMVLLSGLEPNRDIRIEFSGIRPGEKLFEEVSAYQEDTVPTPLPQIRVFTGKGVPGDTMARCLKDLRRSIDSRDAAGILLYLKDLIPEYNPSAMALRRAIEGMPGKPGKPAAERLHRVLGDTARRAVASAGSAG